MAANYFKKRSPLRSRSRLSYSSASEDDKSLVASPAISVPSGLRSLLNDISREVLLGQPSVEELYGFCATYLEQRLEERTTEDESEEIPKKPSLEPQNSFERNIAEITRQSVQSATLDHSLDQNPNPNKVKKMLRREGTFSIYDSDSGVESSATYAGHEAVSDGELNQSLDLTNEGVSPAPPPTLEDAMQRLAETIKEFDSHAMTDQAKSNDTIQARQQPKQNMSQAEEDQKEEEENETKMDQGQSRKLIELVIWDRFNESNVTADNEVGGSQLEKIKIALDETGVEIIPETSSEQLEGQTVVQIPLHLVDRQRKQSEQKKVEGRSQRWEQQNLPPIEVGLQLGHPEQVEPPEKEKAIVEHGGTQTESKELAHAEVQTHAPNDLVSHSTTSSQTDLDCSHPKEDQVNTRSVTETVTSETQTPTVERGEQSNQTEEKSLLDQEVQTANEDFLTEETLITEGVVAGQPTQGSRPLQERPPTLPGSSIEEPHIEQDFLRTRTVSPQNLKVQDDVVARVLLEHVGTVFPSVNPRLRSGVNYLDLSRLGDEGETPASDEIWLAVDGSGCHSEDDPIEEDKFLTTDDTETYSIATDKLSTAATMAGYGNNTGPTLLQAPSSANLLSEQELADLGGCESFDAEAEATARLQGVLASELIPLHTTVQSTDKNVVNLTSKFGNMENVLGTLCTTIERLQSQVPKNTDGSEDIQIKKVTNAGQRVVTPPSRSSPNGGGIRGTDVRLLDQLVARIEHLSSDVANMDASRQLREDNLLLRKELQTYRERELAMMTRLESLEKRLNDFQVRPSSHHRRHQRSRRSSIASSRGTPELPPIETRSRSVDSPKEKPEKAQQEEKLEPLSNANNEEPTRQSTPPKDKTSLDKIVKQPLLPKSKTTKNGVPKLPRRTSNSSSNSSQGSGNEELPENIKAIKKRQPITPKLDNDYLQTEIQIQRSDNSILRQDLQVQKLREQQLYARNKELQEKLIEATSPRPHSRDERTPPTGQEKSEVNINVDFVTEDGGGPKAVFETKKEAKTGKKTPPSRDSSKERGKPAPLKKDLSKDKIAVPKNKKKSTSSSSGSSAEGERSKIKEESEANVTAEKEKPDKKVSLANDAKNGVPKTKPTANGKAKKQTNGKTTNGKKSSPKGSSSSEDLVKKEQLIDDEEWKVTITSKHELETHSDDPNKVVIVKPKPVEEVKEEVKEVAKKAVKAKKAKKLDKVKDPRHDPIPKPSMFPAARPPRGYVPPCALPNASPGVTAAITGSYGPMGYGGGDGLLMTPGRSGYRSGRASSIDSDSGEVISMMIKQEPRDSLVDAVPPRIHPPVLPRTPSRTPAPPPICQVRESPDGENSSKCILAGAELAESGRNSTACGIGEITEEEVAENRKQGEDNKVEGPRDVIREYVLQEEEKIAKRKAKLPLKFKDLKPVSVAKNRAKLNTQRKQWRPMRSMSTDKLLESKKTKSPTLPKMGTMGRHSMERLPTLSAFDEERIVWLKNLEDDICMEEERRARSQLRQNQQNLVTDSASSSAQSSPSTCISRGTSPYNRLQRNKLSSIKKKMPPDAQLDKIQHELSVQNEDQDVKVIEGESKPQSFDQEDAVQEPQEPQIENEGAELKEVPEVENEKQKVVETSSSSNNTLEDQVKRKQLRRSLKKKERELAEERRRSKSRKKYPPLSAECFLVSRGWQLDQTRLLRALDRLKVANFGRVQLATTINRVVESIRPHLDAVIIHIGNQELIEAAYSVVSVTETGENMRDTAAIGLSVAGSVATVMCRHIITAANQNRATQFVVSLPLPVSLAKSNFEADIHYTELRRMFNATMKANCQTCPNIQCCENENLLSSGNNLPPLKPKIEPAVAPNCTPIKQCSFEAKPNTHEYEKYILDNHQVTAAGMRKLARNWENCLNRIDRASDGQLMLRRSSDSSEANTSTISTSSAGDRGDPVGAIENDPILQNGGGDEKQQRSGSASSSGGSRSTDSLETRAPWKP